MILKNCTLAIVALHLILYSRPLRLQIVELRTPPYILHRYRNYGEFKDTTGREALFWTTFLKDYRRVAMPFELCCYNTDGEVD